MSESSLDIDKLSLDELKVLLVQALLERIVQLEKENQKQRDEIARLKGLNEKPQLKPSGMKKKARPRSGKEGGHTHECDDQTIGKTRIISNQLGYPDNRGGFECAGFDKMGKIFEI